MNKNNQYDVHTQEITDIESISANDVREACLKLKTDGEDFEVFKFTVNLNGSPVASGYVYREDESSTYWFGCTNAESEEILGLLEDANEAVCYLVGVNEGASGLHVYVDEEPWFVDTDEEQAETESTMREAGEPELEVWNGCPNDGDSIKTSSFWGLSNFKPTHVIVLKDEEEIFVRKNESHLYTKSEWDSATNADWTINESSELEFQGSIYSPLCDGVSFRKL